MTCGIDTCEKMRGEKTAVHLYFVLLAAPPLGLRQTSWPVLNGRVRQRADFRGSPIRCFTEDLVTKTRPLRSAAPLTPPILRKQTVPAFCEPPFSGPKHHTNSKIFFFWNKAIRGNKSKYAALSVRNGGICITTNPRVKSASQ